MGNEQASTIIHNEILKTEQVADLLQMNRETVKRYASQGIIPGTKIGKVWRFYKQDIINMVRGETTQQV